MAFKNTRGVRVWKKCLECQALSSTKKLSVACKKSVVVPAKAYGFVDDWKILSFFLSHSEMSQYWRTRKRKHRYFSTPQLLSLRTQHSTNLSFPFDTGGINFMKRSLAGFHHSWRVCLLFLLPTADCDERLKMTMNWRRILGGSCDIFLSDSLRPTKSGGSKCPTTPNTRNAKNWKVFYFFYQ